MNSVSRRTIGLAVVVSVYVLLVGGSADQLPAADQAARPSESPRTAAPPNAGHRFPVDGRILPSDDTAEEPVPLDEPPSPIDLATAFALAGIENPDILVAMQRTLAATARQQLAAAQILPNLNFGTNYDLHRGVLQQASGNILSVNRDALYVGGGVNAVAAGSVGVPGIQYNLNVGESLFRYYAERQLTEASVHQQHAVRNRILLDVALAYLNLVRAQALRSVALQSRGEAQEIAEITSAYAKTGEGLPSDAERAATQLALRKVDVLRAEAEMSVASARLVETLNLQTTTRLYASDEWLTPHPAVPEIISRRELLSIAAMQRPELWDHRARVAASLTMLDNAKLLLFSPQVMFGVSSGLFGGGSNLIASDQSVSGAAPNQSRFGNFDARGDLDVVAFWSFRNLGVGNKALINDAGTKWQQADLDLLRTFNRVQREVVDAHVRILSNFSQINIREKAVRSGRQAYRQDLIRIRSNEGHPIEALDSLRLLRTARQAYIDTIVNYNRAHFELYWAVGNPPADVLVRPANPEPAPPAETE